LAEGGAVAGTNLDANVALGAVGLIDNNPPLSVKEEGRLRAGLHTDTTAVALIDGVWIVTGNTVEVAALEKDDVAVARSIDRAEPYYVIEVPLGYFHG
jgi:hypothetical protein